MTGLDLGQYQMVNVIGLQHRFSQRSRAVRPQPQALTLPSGYRVSARKIARAGSESPVRPLPKGQRPRILLVRGYRIDPNLSRNCSRVWVKYQATSARHWADSSAIFSLRVSVITRAVLLRVNPGTPPCGCRARHQPQRWPVENTDDGHHGGFFQRLLQLCKAFTGPA